MKLKISHITLLLLSFIYFNGFTQQKSIKGYRIEGNVVVFTFDKRDYEIATNEKNQEQLDFEDFDIKKVFVAGNFNNWSRNQWKMSKVNDNIYELRKKIIDFKDNFNWEFKFVINNFIWAEPSNDISNVVLAKTENRHRLYTYNLNFSTALPTKNGNVKFRLKGYLNASNVILSGSFNKWNEKLFRMQKTVSGWELTLQLKPNKYEYRFIIDGHWIEDPNNPNKVHNEFGEYNSVLDIQTEVEFTLDNFTDAKQVVLAGSFNNWSENSYLMKKTKNGWSYKTKLSFGKHHYKYIIDGKWTLDPTNSIREYDGNGYINSVKMIR